MLQILAQFFGGMGGTVKLPVTATHQPTANIADSVDRSSYTSGSFTPAGGDLMVVFVRTSGAAPATLPSVVDSEGITFTRVFTSSTNTFVFISNAVAAAVARTITVSYGADTALGCTASVYSISGMIRTGLAALRQGKDNTGNNASPPSITFDVAALEGNPTFGALGNTTNPGGQTPPVGWTEGADIGTATPAGGLETVHRDGGFGGTTITWGANSPSTWRGIIVELDASIPGQIGSGVHLINRRRRRVQRRH